MIGEDRWPSVRGSFGLDGEVVSFACAKCSMCETVFIYRLSIIFSLCISRDIVIEQPYPSFHWNRKQWV